MEELNLASLPKYLVDESAAWELLERLRWGKLDGQLCPKCGSIGEHYFLNARSGERTTSTGKVSYRRLWKCRDCRKQFSVLVGTVFESTKVPVSKWLLAIYLMSASKNGISALELQRQLGLGSYQTAWFMAARLREAMRLDPVRGLLSGEVTADETFVGGKPRNKHQQGHKPRKQTWGPRETPDDKTPVFALVTKDEARARVVTDVTARTLRSAIVQDVDLPNTDLRTDGWRGYQGVGKEARSHETVDHGRNEYVRYVDGQIITSNIAESYFARLKRMITGTWHNVSAEHLDRYVTEVSFRWNTKDVSDHQRVLALIAGAQGKRLTYRSPLEA